MIRRSMLCGFARGGYGSNRIAEDALPHLGDAARTKAFLGYSDTGYLLAALYRAGIGQPVHAPMPGDIRRDGGDAAVLRTLRWLGGDRSGEEPTLDAQPTAAFNLMTLAMLCGTPLMPDLAGHVGVGGGGFRAPLRGRLGCSSMSPRTLPG